jgi:hypothetical protein
MKPLSSRRIGPRRLHRSRVDTRGSALFLVLILAVVMGAVMAAILSYSTQAARLEKRSNTRLEATYVAEYAFERAYEQLHTLIGQDGANLPTITQTTGVTNLGTAPSDVFTAAQGYTWKSFLTVPLENGAVVGSHSGFNPAQGSYKFLSVVEFARSIPQQAPENLQFQREWTYVLVPLFQYAIFYNGDLELFPGANFVVNGRVHSNGRIYVGTSASITFEDYVSNVNGLTNNYSALDPRGPGSPGSTISYNRGRPITTTREDPPAALNQDLTDTNPNNDGARELIEMPDLLYFDANAPDRIYNKAGLKVLANTTGVNAAAPNGLGVPANSRLLLTRDGTTIPASDPLAIYLNGMMATGTMKDYRESVALSTTDIDVSKVNSAYNGGALPQTIPSTANWPNNASVPAALKNQPIPATLRGKDLWNGVIYVADVTNSGSHRTGVRLLNGGNLPDGTNAGSPTAGLTVGTINALYIVGDYNTGGAPPVNSSVSLTANNYAPGYSVQPAAVIADAVTVVSANWTSGNYNNAASLNSRDATNTTINAALVSGVVASDGAAYSGGVENYIRLLEDWSTKRLTYYGSIINVYASQQSTAHWQTTGNYYNAPARNWYFDVNFRDPRKLPPGTPVIRSLKRGQWVQIR